MAMGCMGMSLSDFVVCTPSEFQEVCNGWEQRRKDEWERARWQMVYSVAPWTTKKMTPSDVLHLPWDEKEQEKKAPEHSTRERFEMLKEKMEKK